MPRLGRSAAPLPWGPAPLSLTFYLPHRRLQSTQPTLAGTITIVAENSSPRKRASEKRNLESAVQPSSHLRTPVPHLLFYFPLQSDPWASLPTPSPLQFWSLGTHLLLLTELLPHVLQQILITHGVALKAASFSGHHVTTPGKQAGFAAVFPESDPKREGQQAEPLQQGSLTGPAGAGGTGRLGSRTCFHLSSIEEHQL